jgi:hypothetical protein
MTARRNGIWRAVVAATVIAVGLAVVWALVGGWVVSTVASNSSARTRDREEIYVAANGTPVVSVDSSALMTGVTLSRRTLEGAPFPVDYETWLMGAGLAPQSPAPGFIRMPIRWNYGERLGGGTDGRRPPTAWYVVRDAEPVGHCYFVGYDAFSKQLVGYIGRNGFSAAPPEREGQFALPATNDRLASAIASTQHFNFWGMVYFHSLSEKQKPAPWLVFVVESDKLWKVDLRERSAQVALEVPNVLSVGVGMVLAETLKSLPPEGQADMRRRSPVRLTAAQLLPTGATATFRIAQPAGGKEPETASVIALRTNDKVLMYDADTGRKKEFVIPVEVRDRRLMVYWIAPEKLLLQIDLDYWSGGQISKLVWTDASGKVERSVEVKLAGWVPDSPRDSMWMFCAMAPILIAWLAALLIFGPLGLVQTHKAADYSTGLTQTFEDLWPGLVIVLVVSLALAWATWRLQRKYRRSATGLWTAFVFLLGLPGFLAYWLGQHRPKMEACAECGTVVPRDRDACAACKAPFRPPAPVGTEIFA